MDLRSMLNPVALNPVAEDAAALKTPQRTVSLAQPPTHNNNTYDHNHNHSPHLLKTSLPRTTSLPAQATHYRRESTASVSPKTMPPPAPVPFQTPSPVMSRKRSLSISDHQHTPQPAKKKLRYDEPPPWARRERDGFRFELPPRSEPVATPQPQAREAAPPPANNHQAHGPPSSNISSRPLEAPSYEPSLDNVEPYNDIERQVCDFLFQNIINQDWQFTKGTKIEVEAKLGRLMGQQGDRYNLPILTETVLHPHNKPQFQSMMTTKHHAHLNKYLNTTVQLSQKPGRHKIKYQHLRETDRFYDMPPQDAHMLEPVVKQILDQTGKRPRIRVTTDNATGQITAIIVKTRVHDMEIYCPADEFDCRISISLESPWGINPIEQRYTEHLDQGVPTARGKDRLSYKHQGFMVDLTQVSTLSNPGASKVHELEIEMDVDRLLVEGIKNMEGLENEYTRIVSVFMNNVKVVNRAARPVVAPGP